MIGVDVISDDALKVRCAQNSNGRTCSYKGLLPLIET